MARILPHVTYTHYVKAKSTRPMPHQFRLGVVHDTEGANLPGITDLKNLGAYWDEVYGTPRESSCAVAVDADGNSGRYVRDTDKAWHVTYYNPSSLGIENIGHATQIKWPEPQLMENARWMAYWNFHRGIPLDRGSVHPNGTILRDGWLRHSALGVLGGGHVDPGVHYPLHDVLDLARGFREHYGKR